MGHSHEFLLEHVTFMSIHHPNPPLVSLFTIFVSLPLSWGKNGEMKERGGNRESGRMSMEEVGEL